MAEMHTDFWVVAGTTGPVLLAAHLIAVERARRVILQLVPDGAPWTWQAVLRGNRIQAVIAKVISSALLLAGIITAADASVSAFEGLGSPEVNDANMATAVSQLKFSLILFTVQGLLPLIYPFVGQIVEWLDELTNTDEISHGGSRPQEMMRHLRHQRIRVIADVTKDSPGRPKNTRRSGVI